MKPEVVSPAELETRAKAAKDQLDKHAYEIVQHHFHDSSGCPFWLNKKRELKFDPLKEVKSYADIQKFPLFEDEWLAAPAKIYHSISSQILANPAKQSVLNKRAPHILGPDAIADAQSLAFFWLTFQKANSSTR